MIYLIEYSDLVKKQFKKLNSYTRDILLKKIFKLNTHPSKRGKHIKKNFYELKHKNYRIYYKILHGLIIIDKIKYAGKVHLDRMGNKNTQSQDIKKLV